jgi:hypothetical protein
VFAHIWDGIEGLCTHEKRLYFIQRCPHMWYDVAREQKTKVEDKAVKPKDGERETEDINGSHLHEYDSNETEELKLMIGSAGREGDL